MKKIILSFATLLAFVFGAKAQQTTLAITASQLPYTLGSAEDAQGGSGIQYRWYKNGEPIPSAALPAYTIPTTDYTEGTAVITYTRAAKCAECPDWLFSNPIAVAICAAADLPVATMDYTCANNQEATFAFTVTSGSADQYAWSIDGGATYSEWRTVTTWGGADLSQGQATRFAKAKNSANGCVSKPFSGAASLPAAVVALSGGTATTADLNNGVVCPGVAVTATASVVGGSGAIASTNGYDWDGAGFTSSSKTNAKTPNNTALSTVRWTLNVKDSKGCVSSNTARAAVNSVYVGTDYVAGSCEKRTAGAMNWQVNTIDSRDESIVNRAVAVKGVWWHAGWLVYQPVTPSCASCASYPWYMGGAVISNVSKMCPSGWTLPTVAEGVSLFPTRASLVNSAGSVAFSYGFESIADGYCGGSSCASQVADSWVMFATRDETGAIECQTPTPCRRNNAGATQGGGVRCIRYN